MEKLKSQYGLVGYPVGHSLSPLMHNAAFDALEIDACYKLFPLQPEELDPFFKALREASSPIFGLNVTIPYKEQVLSYLDVLSPLAKKIMAVNTIMISTDRSLTGYNTDGPGFLAHIAELDFSLEGKHIALLGAGGAARAIVSSLCLIPDRPQCIKIYDIDKEKAGHLISDLAERFDVSIVEVVNSIDDLYIESSDLLINATPIGMKKEEGCLVEKDLLHPDMLVYDLIYNPAETRLLTFAKEVGAQTANGLGMLFYQGVLAFQHWANLELDHQIKNKMRKSLETGLNL